MDFTDPLWEDLNKTEQIPGAWTFYSWRPILIYVLRSVDIVLSWLPGTQAYF